MKNESERFYNPVYKCRLCGERFHLPYRRCIVATETLDIPADIHGVDIYSYALHICGDDKGVGYADLIGFSPVQPDEPKVECNLYDKEETHENCTVQVLTNTTTGEVSVGWWKNTGPDVDFICRFLAEHFDVPCGYTFDDVDVPDILPGRGDWCEGWCERKPDCSSCWKRFFEIWRERTGE